jgi:hypothetical protein
VKQQRCQYLQDAAHDPERHQPKLDVFAIKRFHGSQQSKRSGCTGKSRPRVKTRNRAAPTAAFDPIPDIGQVERLGASLFSSPEAARD